MAKDKEKLMDQNILIAIVSILLFVAGGVFVNIESKRDAKAQEKNATK